MKTECPCGQPIKRVWQTTSTPMPPGDLGGCPVEEKTVWGSCGNSCPGVRLGQLPLLTILEQSHLWSIEQVKEELGLE